MLLYKIWTYTKFVVAKSNTLIFLSLGAILVHNVRVQISPLYGSEELPTRPYLVKRWNDNVVHFWSGTILVHNAELPVSPSYGSEELRLRQYLDRDRVPCSEVDVNLNNRILSLF